MKVLLFCDLLSSKLFNIFQMLDDDGKDDTGNFIRKDHNNGDNDSD
jgi:hypothetical protein